MHKAAATRGKLVHKNSSFLELTTAASLTNVLLSPLFWQPLQAEMPACRAHGVPSACANGVTPAQPAPRPSGRRHRPEPHRVFGTVK